MILVVVIAILAVTIAPVSAAPARENTVFYFTREANAILPVVENSVTLGESNRDRVLQTVNFRFESSTKSSRRCGYYPACLADEVCELSCSSGHGQCYFNSYGVLMYCDSPTSACFYRCKSYGFEYKDEDD